MNVNQAPALASEVYLVQTWQNHTGTPTERRCKIFTEFVKLGMRARWQWHKLGQTFVFSTAERRDILENRPHRERSIASWIGDDLRRVMVTSHAVDAAELQYRTDWTGDDMLVCQYDGNPFEVLPELAYSMTAFDDPDDVEEARLKHRDQSLWVSGVFWMNEKIVWVDETGQTIREKNVAGKGDSLKEASECFEKYKPFESTWWTEAIKVGKYAEDEWWH